MSDQNKVLAVGIVVINNNGIPQVIRVVARILLKAVKVHAKKILFVPQQGSFEIKIITDDKDLLVRFSEEVSADFHNVLIVRIKIISGMMISKKNEVQTGSFKFSNMPFMTAEVKPTQFGEAATISLQ